jgi:hypothetical protein
VKHSILVVLQHYGVNNLRECHGWQKMKCPIHEDSHASAGVNIDENIFTCHGCGVKGDTYKLIMEKEGFNTSSGRLPSQKRADTGRRKYSPPRSRRTSTT